MNFQFTKQLIDQENTRLQGYVLKSVEGVSKLYYELVESVLRSLIPEEIRGDLEKSKQWIEQHDGRIVRGSALDENDEAVMLDGRVIGLIRKTYFYDSDYPQINIEWIDLRK